MTTTIGTQFEFENVEPVCPFVFFGSFLGEQAAGNDREDGTAAVPVVPCSPVTPTGNVADIDPALPYWSSLSPASLVESPQVEPLELEQIEHNVVDSGEGEVASDNVDTMRVENSTLGDQQPVRFLIHDMLELFSRIGPREPKFSFLYHVCQDTIVVGGSVVNLAGRLDEEAYKMQTSLLPQDCSHRDYGNFQKSGKRLFQNITRRKFQRKCTRKGLIGHDPRQWTLARLVWAKWADKYLTASQKGQRRSKASRRSRTTTDASRPLEDRGVTVESGVSSVYREGEEMSGTIPQLAGDDGDRVPVVEVGRVEALERRVEQLEVQLLMTQMYAVSVHLGL